MKVDAQTLLDALEGRLSPARVVSLTEDLRAQSPAAVFTLAQAAHLSISGDGNIVGNNNVSLVVKGEGAAELAAVLREALYRGRALFQLRPPVGDFVGREKEIAELMTALRNNQAAAISGISGMGGIGKTELALYVADKLRGEYPDAQLFVSLRGTDPTPRLAVDALQSCLHALVGQETRLPDEEEALTQLYRSQLSGKRALILLDNAADGAQVRPLLPPTGCALLVTSRLSFALPGSKRLQLDQLHPDEARALLLSIAPRLTTSEADQIASLCGYLPLALRAAGSLLEVTIDLEPADYVARLQAERTRLAEIGTEGIEIGVEATFQLSYERLSAEAARVFRCVSVMQGSFDAQAAEVIAEDERHAQLSELVKRSLVNYDGTTKRYRLHDLARLFAGTRIEAAERLTAQRQHATHYVEVLSAADELYLQGHEGVLEGLALFTREWSQIVAGQVWAAAQRDTDATAAQLCVQYPDAGADVLGLRQPPRERVQWLEAMLAAARRLAWREAEGAALGNLGTAYKDLGEARRAIEYHEQDLQIAREIGDRRGEGNAHWNRALAWNELGDRAQAIADAEAALVLYEQIEDPNAAMVRQQLAEWR